MIEFEAAAELLRHRKYRETGAVKHVWAGMGEGVKRFMMVYLS